QEAQRAVLALKSGHPRPLPDDHRQTKFFEPRFFPTFSDPPPKQSLMFSRLKAELQRIATSRIAESANRSMQRIVSVILPICVHLRNLRTRNLRLIHPVKQLARSVRRILLPPGLFSAHLTVPGRFSCAGLMINEAAGP